MKMRLLFVLALLTSMAGAWADDTKTVLPWGADEPWQMKYVLDTDMPDDDWTKADYDDSAWETLNGPLANSSTDGWIYSIAQYTWEDRDIRFNLRRTFTLDEVNPEGYTFAMVNDNEVRLYVNGQLAVAYDGPSSDTNVFHLDDSLFREGENQLAIYFHGGGGPDYLDYALFAGNYAEYHVPYRGFFIDNIHYRLNDDGETLTAVGRVGGYDPAHISFPASVSGYPVTGIDSWGFQSENLTSVFIPKSFNPNSLENHALFWGATNIDYIEVDAENPFFDSRNNCNCLIRTETNEVVRVGNKGIIPAPCTFSNINPFEYCKHIFIPKHITNDWGMHYTDFAETIVVEEGNTRYDSRENCNCIIETANNRLVVSCPQSTIPSSVTSFGGGSLMSYGERVLYFPHEYPGVHTEGVGDGWSTHITLRVPEGTIPRYLYQGWHNDNAFKIITDGTHSYRGQIEGDTWFSPHIECVNFPISTAGEEVSLSVVLNVNEWDSPVTAFQFDAYLPDGLELTLDEDGLANILLSTARTTERKHTLESKKMSDGAWRVICYSNSNSTFTGCEGELCTIRVKVSGDLANNSVPIVFRNVTTTCIDGEGNKSQVERESFTSYVNFFTPEYPPLGDANNDGAVNVTDIATVVSYILGNQPTKFAFGLADVYQDGKVNVTDVAAIVDIIMSSTSQQNAPKRKVRRNTEGQGTATATARLEVIPFTMAPGEEREVEVVLNNPDDDFTGLQFDLTLPEGITLASDEIGYFVELGSRTTSRRHTVDAQKQADGTIRIMAYSNSNLNFKEKEGDVIVLTLKADEQLKAGIYDLALRNIVLSQADGGEISQQEPQDYEGSVLSGTIMAENPAIKGDITTEAAAAIAKAMDESVTSIDLTKAVAVAEDAEFATTNPNTLILVAEGTQVNTRNVVAGNVCADLVLSDKGRYATPHAFTATKLTLSRALAADKWNTIVLPFAIAAGQVEEAFGQGARVACLNDLTEEQDGQGHTTRLDLKFATTDQVPAHTPVLVRTQDSKAGTTFANVSVTPQTAPMTEVKKGRFVGTYAPQTLVPDGNVFISSNQFWYSTGNTRMDAFRAYVDLSEVLGQQQGVKLQLLVDDTETGINEIENGKLTMDNAAIYNLAGQRLGRTQRGVNIVNGKKIIK